MAVFLTLLRENGGHGDASGFSPRATKTRFVLSEDTRSKGLRELVHAAHDHQASPGDETDFQAEALHMYNVQPRWSTLPSLQPSRRADA